MPDIEVIEKIDETIKVQIPKLYKVILLNDNTTTFDFVIEVLMRIFQRCHLRILLAHGEGLRKRE